MATLRKENIKVLVESSGTEVTDEVAAILASELEYNLREILEHASKFMRQSKRRRLLPEDINHALRLRNVEPVYGYGHNILSLDKEEPLYRKAPQSDVFYTPERCVDLAELIKIPISKVPADVSFTCHWLAIDGEQPAIPENPPTEMATASTSGPSKDHSKRPDASAAVPVVVKPIIKHDLSREQQLYYLSVTEGIIGTPEGEFRLHVLDSLRQDAGVHPLLPYFAQFIMDKVQTNLKKLPVLMNLMRLAGAILENPNLFPAPYLHQFLPPILTCIVFYSKGLEGDHWSLRSEAAKVLVFICQKFGSVGNLQARVTKTLVEAFLSDTKPLATHFGALVALSSLGATAIETLIIKNLSQYKTVFDIKANKVTEASTKVLEVLKEACTAYVKNNPTGAEVAVITSTFFPNLV